VLVTSGVRIILLGMLEMLGIIGWVEAGAGSKVFFTSILIPVIYHLIYNMSDLLLYKTFPTNILA
jgi:hypothetical protein